MAHTGYNLADKILHTHKKKKILGIPFMSIVNGWNVKVNQNPELLEKDSSSLLAISIPF